MFSRQELFLFIVVAGLFISRFSISEGLLEAEKVLYRRAICPLLAKKCARQQVVVVRGDYIGDVSLCPLLVVEKLLRRLRRLTPLT